MAKIAATKTRCVVLWAGIVVSAVLPARAANQPMDMARRAEELKSLKWGMFICWSFSTLSGKEWTPGVTDVSFFRATGCDTDQWARTAKEAGSQFDHYTVEYTFADGTKLFAFSRHMHNCWETYWDYVHDSKGSAVLMATLGEPRPKIYRGHSMTPENLVWEFGQNDPNPYVVEWQLLLDAIRKNKPYNEARRVGEAEVAPMMGRMATHNGQSVTWDQAMNSQFQFVADIDHMTFDTPTPIHAGPDGLYAPPQPGITKEC